jgi:L-glyceraldehyde 3-phosphate reductase
MYSFHTSCSGIPENSRAVNAGSFVRERYLSEQNLHNIKNLNAIAEKRGQSLAQMALAWVARQPAVTTVLIGASRPEQIIENIKAFDNIEFSKNELIEIDKYAVDGGVNLWAESSKY